MVSLREEERKEGMSGEVEGIERIGTGSRIFGPLKTLGHVSNHVPCLLRYIHRRRENFVITCVGRSFHTYASQKLQLLSRSGSMEDEIISMTADTYHVYTASRNQICAWRRGFELKHTYFSPSDSNILQLLPYAPNLLALHADGTIYSWDIVHQRPTQIGSGQLKSNFFSPILLAHPATYINKILVASEEGAMVLLNTRTGDIVHHFSPGFGSRIICLEQSPAVDVMGVVLADGRVLLHNIKFDDTLMTFRSLEEPVSLAFRLDGPPFILVGTKQGSLTIWDLESREVIAHMEKSHQGPVTGLEFFPQEPLLASSSPDNSVKIWIFDMPDGSCRLLNSRDGHHKPPQKIRFFGKETETKNILSAGADGSFRIFHVYNETYNRVLSKNKVTVNEMKLKRNFMNMDDTNLQMPAIVDFTTQTVAAPSHYEDIAACHAHQVGISTWSFANSKRGEKLLMLPKYKDVPKVNIAATCICTTSCCQFVIAGYDNGTVERFNIQSGLHRKTYGNPAHSESVRGIAVDQVSTVVLSAGADSKLRFWDFKTGKLVSELTLSAPAHFVFHRITNHFVGIALDNFTIVIINFIGRQVFRKFTEICNPLTDACFSPDNMWITAASSDCLIRTWDLTTGDLVDIVRVDSIVSTLDYSPNGEYLAGGICNSNGIFLWSNKTLFESVSLLPLQQDYEPEFMEAEAHSMNGDFDKEMLADQLIEYASPEQIAKDLVTLSLLPRSQWKNLLNLDIIRMRNKPKQPPKTYVAPFFLPSLLTNNTNHEIVTVANGIDSDISRKNSVQSSKILNLDMDSIMTPFGKIIQNFDPNTEESIKETIEVLAEMGPSEIDTEIRSLGLDGVSIELVRKFLQFGNCLVQSKTNFEGSQAYLALFLKVHGETISENDELLRELRILKRHLLEVDTVPEKINKILGYTAFLRSKLFKV